MGWDGSGNVIRTNGTNTGGTVWQDDADADVKIRADRHDTHDQDLADAIEQALNRNGENSPSTNIGWGNHKITNLGDGNSSDDAATVGQVQSQIAGVAQASGTDALTATFSPAITAFTDKTTVYVRAAAANTSTTPTFKPNALAAKTITKEGNQALVAGDIAGADHVIILQYHASNDVWEMLNPATFSARFPNIDAEVTKTDEDLNTGIIPGLIQMYGGSSEPSGWLFCSGQAVSRSTYSALFNVVGTKYGAGDGSTTFNVPDLRDRSPLGENSMGATDAGRVDNYTTALGDAGGEDQHQNTEAEMPSHNHGNGSLTADSNGNHDHSIEVGEGTTVSAIESTAYVSLNDGSTSTSTRSDLVNNSGGHGHNISGSTANAGSDNPHNNMHPFLALNFIIKT